MFKHTVLCLALLTPSACASPAQDLMDEAVYHLALLYGGSSTLKPARLAEKYHEQLDRRCNGQGEACPASMAEPVLRDLLGELHDPHTYYLTPQQYAQLLGVRSGSAAAQPSFGLIVESLPGAAGLVVLEVQPGSPAHHAGVQRGDRLLALDGLYLPALADQRYEALHAGERSGAPVRLTLIRGGADTHEVVVKGVPLSLQRLPTLTLRPDNVAVLRIPWFLSNGVGERVHELVAKAHDSGAKALVVDLRHNPGGLVTEYLASVAPFAPDAQRIIDGQLRSRYRLVDGAVRLQLGQGREFPQVPLNTPSVWRGPLAVLVNAHSASGAEFFALDVQESRRGLIVGSRTAGAANTATAFIGLSNGGAVAVTTGKALRANGDGYPAHVQPDVTLNDDLGALARGQDVVLERAVSELLR